MELVTQFESTTNWSLTVKSTGFGLTDPLSPTTETTVETTTGTKPFFVATLPLLQFPEVEPEIRIAKNDKEVGNEDEEAEVAVAVEMKIVPVRARLVYIGCKGLDAWIGDVEEDFAFELQFPERMIELVVIEDWCSGVRL